MTAVILKKNWELEVPLKINSAILRTQNFQRCLTSIRVIPCWVYLKIYVLTAQGRKAENETVQKKKTKKLSSCIQFVMHADDSKFQSNSSTANWAINRLLNV